GVGWGHAPPKAMLKRRRVQLCRTFLNYVSESIFFYPSKRDCEVFSLFSHVPTLQHGNEYEQAEWCGRAGTLHIALIMTQFGVGWGHAPPKTMLKRRRV
ncbi:MAG: hypothetical protein ABW107_07855, partial [Candidatus Thiodiazotropha sp. 6PLUC5]